MKVVKIVGHLIHSSTAIYLMGQDTFGDITYSTTVGAARKELRPAMLHIGGGWKLISQWERENGAAVTLQVRHISIDMLAHAKVARQR